VRDRKDDRRWRWSCRAHADLADLDGGQQA
jgi:hypothetical protein